jgi:hypothetical protein
LEVHVAAVGRGALDGPFGDDQGEVARDVDMAGGDADGQPCLKESVQGVEAVFTRGGGAWLWDEDPVRLKEIHHSVNVPGVEALGPCGMQSVRIGYFHGFLPGFRSV